VQRFLHVPYRGWLVVACVYMALAGTPALAQEYGPYPLDGPPYGSDYYPFDYNLPGGRTRPGIPPPGPYPFPDELRRPRPFPPYCPECDARRIVCPPGSCGPDDDE
jgi:hypothetical protein